MSYDISLMDPVTGEVAEVPGHLMYGGTYRADYHPETGTFTHNILSKAKEFKQKCSDEIGLVKAIYEFVRDEIKHSWDVQDKRVTKSATEVLENKAGICWGKANLLAALLRACDIPAGICYQRLTLGDVPETGFCIHALNAVYMKKLNRWIRLDARGNKENVNAQFDLEHESLAFPVRKDIGEVDYGIIYANPSDKLMKVLEESTGIGNW